MRIPLKGNLKILELETQQRVSPMDSEQTQGIE